MKNYTMVFDMPYNENITGRRTTTIALCESGLRTSTTRSFPLGNVGDIITFNNRPQRYKIVSVEKLNETNTKDPKWIEKWSRTECWTVEHFHKIFGGKTVHIGSYQTIFYKIPTPVVNKLI